MVCEMRSRYFDFLLTKGIYDEADDVVEVYNTSLWLVVGEKVEKGSVGGCKEVKSGLLLGDEAVAHAEIDKLQVILDNLRVLLTEFLHTLQDVLLLDMLKNVFVSLWRYDDFFWIDVGIVIESIDEVRERSIGCMAVDAFVVSE